MNVQQKELIGNSKFAPISDFPTNNHPIETLLHDLAAQYQERFKRLVKDIGVVAPHQKQQPSPNQILIPCFDRLGRIMPIALRSGNICVVGSSQKDIAAITVQITESFATYGAGIEVIGAADFLELKQERLHCVSTTYLVQFNTDQDHLTGFYDVAEFIANYFLLPIPSLKILCSLNGEVSNSGCASEIIDSLDSKFATRKYLLASCGQDEFLAVVGAKEYVRLLKSSFGEGC